MSSQNLARGATTAKNGVNIYTAPVDTTPTIKQIAVNNVAGDTTTVQVLINAGDQPIGFQAAILEIDGGTSKNWNGWVVIKTGDVIALLANTDNQLCYWISGEI